MELFELFEKYKEEIIFIEKQMKMFEALTEKRLELVKTVIEKRPNSIRELANILERDVKNVFNDLKILNKLKIIKFVRKGRCVVPKVKKRIIIISLGGW